jgi:hypothetical protein
MTPRLLLPIAFALLCGPAFGAPMARPAHPVTANEAPIAFYVVKGSPDSCGQGCDRWIAAEGKIDNAAAARFRTFMKRFGDPHLPIYFHSPGGNLDQALVIGNMLREKKMAARVGRTVATECGFEAQDSNVCVKLKQSGRELHGDVWLRYAECNSACPYLILGAVNREIAPEALLAVHSPRVTLNFTGGVPTREMRTAALQQTLARADRMVADYLRKMGADPNLLTASRSVPFESMRILTREEIVRFGLDRREQVETPWTFQNDSRSLIYKTMTRRAGGEQAFRMTQLRLICVNAGRFQLDYQRPVPAAGFVSVSLMDDSKRLNFYFPPRRAAGLEGWALQLNRAQLDKLAGGGQFELSEGTLADGQWQYQPLRFSTEGFAHVLDRLLATCPPAKPAGTPVAARDVVAGTAK